MSNSKEQELFEACLDHMFKKEYADHLASRVGRAQSMSEIRALVDRVAVSLRVEFGPENYDDLLRYAAFVEVFKRESEDNLVELTQTLNRHKRLLELLERDESNSVLKDKVVAALQESTIIERTLDAGKRHGERLRSKAGATARHANDPKQAAKKSCKAEWDDWQNGLTAYTSKAEFARMCLDTHPELTSENVVTGWCREWGKERQRQG